jgi:hypothetical protein
VIGWLARFLGRLVSQTPLTAPIWSGQPPPANVVIVAEPWAGHGDALCLVRYLPLWAQAGYNVGYKCSNPGLGNLLRQSFPSDLRFQDEASIKNKKSAAIQVPTYLFQQMYLPRAFNGKLMPHGVGSGAPHKKLEYRPQKKIKAYVPDKPYLRAAPGRIEYYRRRVPLDTIGLCWASGLPPGASAWVRRVQPIKSMPLSAMAPIYERFPCVSLQVGQDRTQLSGTPVLDGLPARPDWSETAALIMACRAIVCVDTAVAHCAGGLGAPVHLLMHNEPTAYFCVRGVASPWYPHFRVYRGKGSDWSEAVARIAAALGQGASPAVSHSS